MSVSVICSSSVMVVKDSELDAAYTVSGSFKQVLSDVEVLDSGSLVVFSYSDLVLVVALPSEVLASDFEVLASGSELRVSICTLSKTLSPTNLLQRVENILDFPKFSKGAILITNCLTSPDF